MPLHFGGAPEVLQTVARNHLARDDSLVDSSNTDVEIRPMVDFVFRFIIDSGVVVAVVGLEMFAFLS